MRSTHNTTLATLASIASLCVIGINGLLAPPADTSLGYGKTITVDAASRW
jgi:hypothetical protein